MLIFLLTISIQVIIIGFYMLYRNQKVYNYRHKVLNDENYSIKEQLERYTKLPTYEQMLCNNLFKFNWCEYLTKVIK